MAIYEMRKADKAGTVFTTKDTYYTKEYAKQYMPMYLEGHIVVDENGRHRNRYRLHSERRRLPSTSTAPSAEAVSSRSADV